MKAATSLGAGLIFLLLFFTQGVFFIRANSPTYDEAMHLAAGYSYIAKRDFRLNPENPPLNKELLALPLFLRYRLPFNPAPQHWSGRDDFLIGQDFLYRSSIPADRMLVLSRFSNLFLGTCLIALIGWCSYRMWSARSAVLAMGLACFDPNLIAHSSLATADIGVTLFIFLALYFLWEYLNSPTWRFLAATGIATGLALISKFLAILLIPMIGLIITFSLLVAREDWTLSLEQHQNLRRKVIQAVGAFLLISLIALWMILIPYFFQGWRPWLFGLQRLLTLAQGGQAAFLFGEYSYEGWWSYYILAFIIKTPIGSLILIAGSLLLYRAGTPLSWREAMFLLMPPVIIFLVTSQAKVNIGLRHILAGISHQEKNPAVDNI